jgi:hypothetical protein
MLMRTLAGMAALALVLCAGQAGAQTSLRERIAGSWDFVVAEVTAPDGKKSFPFGETPKGLLIFTADGRFSQIHVASDVPKIASGNRLTGTAEEYGTIMRRSIAVFGSYVVDRRRRPSPSRSSPPPSRTGKARRRPAPSTSSPRTSSSTPTRTWPAAEEVPAISIGG